MKRLLHVLTILSCLIVYQTGYAQEEASGRITDNQGTGLQGVNVIQQKTNNGVTTDAGGNFSLQLSAAGNKVLEITYIGFKRMVIPYTGSPLTIALQREDTALQDVVVVGYGTQRRSQLTGAISSVKGADLARTQAVDLGTSLQGMAAGVNVTSPTGAPGTDAVVRIRGIGTLNNNNPLYIIDGVPMTSGLTTISPSDIESIEILKDASAASIYGARAANGVVLVTTKSGKIGKNLISLDASVGIANATGLPKMVNTTQFIELQNEAFSNDGSATRNNDNPAQLPNTDWLEETFQQAITQKYNLGFSGGTEKTRYYISGNLIDQQGTIPGSDFKRYGMRTNVSSDVKDWLKIGENINISYDRTQSVGSSGDGGRPGSLPGVVRYALIRPNAIPVYDPQTGLLTDLPPASLYENISLYGDGKNPLAIANYRNRALNRYRILGNVFAEARLLKGLKLRSDFGTDFFISEQQAYSGQIPGDRTTLPSNAKSVDKFRHRYTTLNWTNTLTYSRSFNDVHDLNITAGSEYVTYKADYLSGAKNGYDNRSDENPDLQYLNYGTGQQFTDGSVDEWALMSYFGRLSYSYMNKWLATASLRSDASSRFGKNNRTGYFPSFSLGWNISRESFMENVGWMNDLKLRGSWGRLGNQEIGLYPFATLYSTANNVLQVVSRGNPDVKWETTEQTDIGADASFLRGRLRLSVDYYKKTSKDILIQLPVSYTNGDAAPPYVNGATMENHGLDISLNYSESRKDWSWDLTGNITTVKNKVTSLYKSKEQLISNILLREDEPVSTFFGYKTNGLFQTQQEVDAYVNKNGELLQPDASPGDIRFTDTNGDGTLDNNDRTIIGHGLPDFLYSLNGTVRYRQFDLNLFFNGVAGNEIYNEVDNIINSFDARSFNSKLDFYKTRWHGEGTSNKTPRATFLDLNNNRRSSDRYVENGSYLRLKNVVLGYTLPSSWLQAAGIASARLFASAQNVFTITDYKGMDPELYTNENLSNYGDLGIGIDMGTYPPSRIFTFGLQVNF